MRDKIKVVAVSYLNTKPFLKGLENAEVKNEIELSVATPAICAEALIEGKAAIGLVPVAMIPKIPNAKIISDYCIGCDGQVGTVALFSNDPIDNINEIILDYQSRTSVQLLKILMNDYWKKNDGGSNHPIQYRLGEKGYETGAKNGQGVLVIGDRAMDLDHHYQYKYDLGSAWKAHTGLPFVFAAWVSTKELPSAFIDAFNIGLTKGLDMIPELIQTLDQRPHFSLEKYYREYISFELDEKKLSALALFMKSLGVNISNNIFLSVAAK